MFQKPVNVNTFRFLTESSSFDFLTSEENDVSFMLWVVFSSEKYSLFTV